VQYRADSLGLSGRVTAIFRDLVHERLGLFYEEAQFDQLADRLAPLVVARGMTSFMDYYYLLKYSDDDGEWGRVMDALAVQETYFWRESDQIRAIVDYVVPSLVEELRGDPLKIWSVPCASGEEPLTLAMMLDEARWFDRAPIEVTGSDASRAAIAKAMNGRYGPRAFRNLSAAMRDKYFTPDGDRWVVDPKLRQRVNYDIVNLVAPDDVARHTGAPIVFCRNLFIYFSDRSITQALEAMARWMPERAYLCLGVSESLLRLRTSFELREIGGAFVYMKETHKRAPASPLPAPALRMRGSE
jgi:chemotaxis protein methyltransferase CheR